LKTKKIGDAPSPDALNLPKEFAPPAGYEVVPKPEAKQLVAYLLSLHADVPLYEAPSHAGPSFNERPGQIKMSDETKSCSTPSNAEPTATRSTVPMWVFSLTLVLLFLGLVYFDHHGGWFDERVYGPYASADQLDSYQPKSGAAAAIARGRKIYESNCGTCHGTDGLGKPNQAPPLAGSEWVKAKGVQRLTHIPLSGELLGYFQITCGLVLKHTAADRPASLTNQHRDSVWITAPSSGENARRFPRRYSPIGRNTPR
jgi:cytochrome c553